jgi:tripartite-type tricarboxylate transporter receptor subunit TctC
MRLPRRQFLRSAASAAVLPAAWRVAAAQTYPSRPLRILVGTPAGGAIDIPARLIGQWLSERLGQSVVIENRPGASTNLATEAVVRSAPDGHTLLAATPVNTVNATLYDKLNFNFIRDIAPVAGILSTPSVMLVNPAIPATSVPGFIVHAKANPGKINMASAGNGTTPHLTGELFKMRTGVDLVHVPYRGGAPALTDLVAGHVQVYFGATSGSIEYIKAGAVRALAVTTAARSELLPDLPTLDDFLPGFEASGWLGIGAPRNTPLGIVDRLNREINAALADPKMRAHLAQLGGTPLAGSPADFGELIAEETAKWAKVIKFAGIKPD